MFLSVWASSTNPDGRMEKVQNVNFTYHVSFNIFKNSINKKCLLHKCLTAILFNLKKMSREELHSGGNNSTPKTDVV